MVDESTRKMLAFAKELNVLREDVRKLHISVLSVKSLLALRVVGADREKIIAYLAALQRMEEEVYAPFGTEANREAQLLDALINWEQKPTPDA